MSNKTPPFWGSTVSLFGAIANNCKHLNQFGVYVNSDGVFNNPNLEDGLEKIKETYGQAFFSSVFLNGDIAMFDNRDDAFKFYNILAEQPFENEIYACLFCPKDGMVTENT